MDVEEHIARHEESINYLAWRYTNNRDDFEDVKQALILLLIERHKSPSYDHSKYTLWTYVQKDIEPTINETLNQYHHFKEVDFAENPVKTFVVPPADVDDEGIANLEALQNIGVVTPINWHHSGYGEQPSTLTPEELEQAQKVMANLTDEELLILDVSYGRSDQQASDYLKRVKGMKISKTTYWRRLKEIKAKAQALTQG